MELTQLQHRECDRKLTKEEILEIIRTEIKNIAQQLWDKDTIDHDDHPCDLDHDD